MARSTEIARKTRETEVRLALDLGSRGAISVQSGVPFLDHLLTAMAHHGGFGLTLRASGDLAVDAHHLVEDVGIVLGSALAEIAAGGGAVARFGHSVIPMDDALAEADIDVCGRPTLVYSASFPQPAVGGFDLALLRELTGGLASSAKVSLHLAVRYGDNSHHMAEALFKALGKALAQAYAVMPGEADAMSTKGIVAFS
jgi:imidazoleglycerol-phosphate dehydratase